MQLSPIYALTALLLAVCAVGKTVRINAGGGALDGYSADTARGFFAKGSDKVSVYSTHAFRDGKKPLVYTIDVPDVGLYQVRLQFAEIYLPASRPGARLLNVDINGARIATDVDVFVRAGNRRFAPYDIYIPKVSAHNGHIVVRITSSRENPMISGIVVKPQGSKVIQPIPGYNGPGRWRTVKTTENSSPVARHEGCALMVAGKVYMIGGRGVKPVSVFDPATKRWTNRPGPGIEIHHFQCAALKDRYIYIAGAWTGRYPREMAFDNVLVYDVETSEWRVEARGGLGKRARGGGAFVFRNGLFYLAMGNRGGHGPHATTLGELDVYNPWTKRWRALPSAPDARDHVHGGVVDGKLCVAGGRDGGAENFFDKAVTAVNCYDFKTNEWKRGAHMKKGRAGAATGVTCGGLLMIAGGEGVLNQKGIAFKRVDMYDAVNDRFMKPSFLKHGRHGSGLAISDCSCGNIYLPSGSGALGGGPELKTTEIWTDRGIPKSGC